MARILPDCGARRLAWALMTNHVERAALRRDGWTFERVIRRVCERVGVTPRDVAAGSRSRSASEARAVVAYFVCERLGMKQSAAGRRLGVGQSAMPPCVVRGRDAARRLFGSGDAFFREAPRGPPSRK
jgi:hypothetical protein